jgi:hypothetical protein
LPNNSLLTKNSSAATSQDVLDFCACNCNIVEIAEEGGRVLICGKVETETALPRANFLLP